MSLFLARRPLRPVVHVVGNPNNWQIASNKGQRDPATSPGSTFYAAYVGMGRAASTGLEVVSVISAIGTGTEVNLGIVPNPLFGRCVAQVLPSTSGDPYALRWIYRDVGFDNWSTFATWHSWVTPFPMAVSMRYALDGAGVLKVTFTATSGETATGTITLSSAAKALYDPITTIGMILMETSPIDSFALTDGSIFDSFNRPDQQGLGIADTGQVWSYSP